MAFALYFDEDSVNRALIRALRARGMEVTNAIDAGHAGSPDPVQLEHATADGRVLFTYNVGDFFALHTRFRQEGRAHAGLILAVQQRYNVIEIGHPSQITPQQFPESFVPLGQDLKDVPVSTSHDVADARDVFAWNVLVKEVAHRVDKDLPRASPMQRLIELFGNESRSKPCSNGCPGTPRKRSAKSSA